MAKAYHEAGHTVWGLDQNQVTQEFAALSGCIDGALTEEKISTCDLILLAAYPAGSEAWLQEMAPCLAGRTVIDCLGTKRHICQVGFALAARYGFTFIGGHPMAGTHNSGLKYARSNLFHSRADGHRPAPVRRHSVFGGDQSAAGPGGLRQHHHHDGGEARRDDRLYVAAGPCRLQPRLYQKPDGGAAQGLFRWQL